MKRKGYTASLPKKLTAYSNDQRDFLERRVMPFLDGVCVRKPMSHLLQEAYLQGVWDVVDVMAEGKRK